MLPNLTTLLTLILTTLTPTIATLNPIDYLALQSLHKSLHDLPSSNFLSKWDFTSDPCSFPGIICAFDRVVALSLGDPRPNSPGLGDSLPPSLSTLTSLTDFSIIPGQVSGPLPPQFPPDLRFLALSSNRISGRIPPSFATLRKLRILDLGSNLLSGPIPQDLLRIRALETVILSHNRLSGEIPAFLSSELRRLDFKNNELSGNIPELPVSILYLSLGSNKLTGHVDGVLSRLNRLNYLDLSMNRLSGPIPGSLFTFPLSSLQLQRNRFEGTVRPARPLAVSGARIDLSYNRFSGLVPAELAPAGRLYLNYNRFFGDVPDGIVRSVVEGRMRVLYLQHNFLTGFQMEKSKLPTGVSVCVQFNCLVEQVSVVCRRNWGLQKSRPREQCVHR